MNPIIEIVIHLLFVMMIYSLYKIAINYFLMRAVEEDREYRGFMQEFERGGFHQMTGLMPVPYEEYLAKSKARQLRKKRGRYVKLFWLFFGGGMVLALLMSIYEQ